MGSIAVFGAAGAVGGAVVRLLHQEGAAVIAVTRRPQALFPSGVPVRTANLEVPATLAPALTGASAAVLTPTATLSVRALPALAEAGVRRALFFTSHNLSVPEAAGPYADLAAAEEAIKQSGLAWTVLRPTLIYGHPELGAVTSLLRLARRLPVLPTPGWGRAKQQPIFYEDLARVAAFAVQDEATAGQVLPVGGPEVLSLQALYACASRAAGGWGFTIPAPLALLRWAAAVGGGRFPLKPEQLHRAEADKHVPDPVAWPDTVRPRVRPEEGFARLAATLAAS